MTASWIKNAALAVGCALLLPACVPYANSPPQMADDLTHRFYGRPANEFFVQYGQPAGDVERSDGSIVYRWNSLYSATDTLHSGPAAQYCELRIYTDSENTIEKIIVMADSMGRESGSRCSEIFNVLDRTYYY